MTGMSPLGPEKLRPTSGSGDFSFASTEELEPVLQLIGQDRAARAIAFGAKVQREGFNMYLSGSQGAGRRYAVRSMLGVKASREPPPDDWIYVNNFDEPHKPVAIAMPPGRAVKFQQAMKALISDLLVVFPAMLETEEYHARRSEIDNEATQRQETAFEELKEKASRESITILRTPMGFMLSPTRDGSVLKPEDFEQLEADEKRRIEATIKQLQGELEKVLEQLPEIKKHRRDNLNRLHGEFAAAAVDRLMSKVVEEFAAIEPIGAYLERVKQDLVVNAELFFRGPAPEARNRQAEAGDAAEESPVPAPDLPFNMGEAGEDGRLRRYGVNVIVCTRGEDCVLHDGDMRGAPLVIEELPSLGNLVGRIEHIARMGTMITDFLLIKPGALHRANGGYLVLDAHRVIAEPGAWETLKLCLMNARVDIISLSDRLGLSTTAVLNPDPIPLKVKVVLVGSRLLYYLLMRLDPDFPELFKVQADFDENIERSSENMQLYARLIATIVKQENLLPLDPGAVARTIDEAARMADDNERLFLRVGMISDLLSEANFCAQEAGRKLIESADVEQACSQRFERASRIRELSHEQIIRDNLLIDTSGREVGQINGLSVATIGGLRFGQPARITAQVRMGSGKVVDIEREVQLGGPLHSKGVLILSSFLASNYALDVPVSLWASLVFEQSYGALDGDSASSAELYALLSALAGVPIFQSFAVTGSVNQKGDVQAIGGVNEKIEGFFDICRARGLTGSQGVLIPVANVKNLMLRSDVVEAAEANQFRIYAVRTIQEGISLLTGVPAGERDADGVFPDGSINALVEARLRQFAHSRRRFAASGGRGLEEDESDEEHAREGGKE